MSDISEIVAKYIEIRDKRDRLAKQYEADDDLLKQELDQYKVLLLNACNSIGANSINTSKGTVIRNLKERYYASDWGAFRQFVKENDAYDCLERRIHQKNFKQLLEENNGKMPSGVSVMSEFDVSVRRPTFE